VAVSYEELLELLRAVYAHEQLDEARGGTERSCDNTTLAQDLGISVEEVADRLRAAGGKGYLTGVRTFGGANPYLKAIRLGANGRASIDLAPPYPADESPAF
jgi:hypothetical protein